MDKLSSERRSANMRAIKSKNTLPEIAVRKIVYRLGYRYQLYRKDIPGKPDLVFLGRRKLIFIHGCFWHQHEACIEGRLPKTNNKYWEPKLQKNRERDERNQKVLNSMGWKVLVIWECEIKEESILIKKIHQFLKHEELQP